MAFREVGVFEVREVLRLWVRGQGYRGVERLAGVDRKTVRRYVSAAEELGLSRAAGEAQLTDAFMAGVVERVRPHRSDGRGAGWRALEAHREQIRVWLEDEDLTVVKVGELLGRRGVLVPARTLQRFAAECCGPRRGRRATVRVADGEPGGELQVDFGRMGLVFDPAAGRNRVCWALIFTACVSRYCYMQLSFTQTTAAVIEGFEAAWAFFGGVFRVVIPDNLTPVVDQAHPLEPRFNQAFIEYAQARGFLIDPARVRHPQDKPRVERNVAYVRSSFFKGEHFIDLPHAQRCAQIWCATTAGLRVHGTTALRPAEHFALAEAPRLLAPPGQPYDLPIYAEPKVARDHHIEVAKALYSVPGNLIGRHVQVRADRALVKVFFRGALVKTHPRQPPGHRSTDPADLPAERSVYPLRDVDALVGMARRADPAIGAYPAVLLDHPLPWTKMRQVYALLGLVKKWGADRVATACAKAADAEAFNVGLIGRMLERATENNAPMEVGAVQASLFPARFARSAAEFATGAGREVSA